MIAYSGTKSNNDSLSKSSDTPDDSLSSVTSESEVNCFIGCLNRLVKLWAFRQQLTMSLQVSAC